MTPITYSFPSEKILNDDLFREDCFDKHPLFTKVFPLAIKTLSNQHQIPTEDLKNILVRCITECDICPNVERLACSALILLAPYADNLEEEIMSN